MAGIGCSEDDRAKQTRLQKEFEEALRTDRAEARARAVSGMGFWRLVSIVTIGILLAQAIGGAAIWLLSQMTSER